MNKFPSVQQLLSESWGVYKKYLKEFLLISGFIIVPSVLALFSRNAVYAAIVGVLGGLLSLWIFAALVYAINAHISKREPVSLKKIFKAGLGFVIPLIFVDIVKNLVIVGAAVPLVIPAIIAAFLLIFTEYVLIVENRKWLDAVLRSRHLVKDNWWNVFSAIVVLSVIIAAIAFGVNLIAIIVVYSRTVSSLIQSVVAALFIPFSLVYLYEIFCHLKAEKPAESFNPLEKRGLYKGLMIWGLIVAVIIAIMASYGFYSN